MSINTFLSKIWAEVKTLFEHMPANLQLAATIAVTVVENIKTVVNDPAVDILTAIIPGNLDDKVIACLRDTLPLIVTELKLVNQTSHTGDAGEKITLAVNMLRSLTGNIKNAFLHDIGVLLATEIARLKGGELTWSDGVYIIEWYYRHKFKAGK